MIGIRAHALILLFLVVACEMGTAAQTLESHVPTYPQDMSQIEVYLGTRDIGHPIYSKYGHTIVRILDRSRATDIGYNWGTFDFDAPGFVPNFLQGILIYYMSFGPWRDEVIISKIERQTMWMERVNLTSNQKARVIERILWNSKPENIHYPYYFFYDNCSTRVRDLFDFAVDGKIKALSSNRMTGKTYRDRVMEHNVSAPFFAMGQDIILNSEPDREMTQWDDMFIPGRLREYLLSMPAFDDSGHEITDIHFLSDTKTLTQFPRPETPLINGYLLIWILCGLPLVGGLLLTRGQRYRSLGFRLIGLANIVLGSLWGFLGIFLTASWIFGSHTVLPHNANLWMIWPVDILYIVVGGVLMIHGSPLPASNQFTKIMAIITASHLVGMSVLISLTVFQVLEQHTARVVFWFVPLTSLCWAASTLRSKAAFHWRRYK
jgi:hypothetical protein